MRASISGLFALLVAMSASVEGGAQAPARVPTVARVEVKPARSATKAKSPPSAKPSRKTAKAPPATAKAGAAPAPAAGVPRTLQDIHIEGEIPVPQVLFVTAPEPRRFMDSQHRRFLRTSREVGEQTAFPWRIAVIRQGPAGPGKETEP